MAKIKGLEGLSNEEINQALNEGAKFVVFRYTISIVLMTFRRSSDIYFVRKDESTFSKSIGFTIINFLFGWWGIPWGPIYTIGSWITNAGGGKDVTQDVLQAMNQKPTSNREVSEELLDDMLMD
jgi:hypothetical protein